ncbi:MAG: hypothetical protein F4166_02995 [Gammaproteobacteria bacterium]|nr:hypothetical protein [Gammaproteobacteria bacterium]
MCSSKPNHSATVLAGRALLRVFNGQPLETSLQRYRESKHYPNVSFLCFQTLRHYFSLAERLRMLLNCNHTTLDREVWAVLLIGACQLQFSSTPRAACVNHLVESIKKLGKTSASSMINAVLRKYDNTTPIQENTSKYELPNWTIDWIQTEYPLHAVSILENNTQHPPLTLRINVNEISVQEYCALLEEQQIEFAKTVVPNAINVLNPKRMQTLPGFEEDYFAVQDLSSQLAVPLLASLPSDIILDACAFPGVKTRQIRDLYPQNQIISVDIKTRCSTWNIRTNDNVLHEHTYIQADLTNETEIDDMRFQRILLDAPCSGSGTLRRHPDIKLHCTMESVKENAELQGKLIRKLWKMLEYGGSMIYTTCSIFHAENDEIIECFLMEHQDITNEAITLPYGVSTKYGWQTIPQKDGSDGFYFCKLRKIKKNNECM